MCVSVLASPPTTASGAPLSATAAPIAVGTAWPMHPKVLTVQVSLRGLRTQAAYSNCPHELGRQRRVDAGPIEHGPLC
jgi:hypothetical protein